MVLTSSEEATLDSLRDKMDQKESYIYDTFIGFKKTGGSIGSPLYQELMDIIDKYTKQNRNKNGE